MNTSGKNAPATVISIVLLVAALLIATLSRGAGLFLSYLLPGVLILERAALEITDYRSAILRVAQTSLREMIGASPLSALMSERRIADQQLKEEIGRKTADWGVALRPDRHHRPCLRSFRSQ
ncbi:MAG: domain, Band 7 family protein [Gammaproteobacteria bacterium]|jgi:hypothetical protein|nr:domain, Band 7 family protein [Gammaproteobacteria bacterium]